MEKCPEARRLQTHPGVGALTALAFVLIIGRAERFQCGKQIASYLGLVPLEESSGNRRSLLIPVEVPCFHSYKFVYILRGEHNANYGFLPETPLNRIRRLRRHIPHLIGALWAASYQQVDSVLSKSH